MTLSSRRICIVTVSKAFDDDLLATVRSVLNQSLLPFKYVLVISSISSNQVNLLNKLLGTKLHSFLVISNVDTGLYNAMNIGIDNCQNDPILFLNAGDTLLCDTTWKDIESKFCDNFINCFSVLNSIKNEVYFKRLSNPYLFRKSLMYKILSIFRSNDSRNPPHQGVITSYQFADISYRYSESSSYYADHLLIRNIIENHNSVFHDLPIATFQLGGISSMPSLRRLRSDFHRFGLISFLLSFIQLIVFTVIGDKNYYSILNKMANNERVDIKSLF